MSVDKAIQNARDAKHGRDIDERISYLADAIEELAKAIKEADRR